MTNKVIIGELKRIVDTSSNDRYIWGANILISVYEIGHIYEKERVEKVYEFINSAQQYLN